MVQLKNIQAQADDAIIVDRLTKTFTTYERNEGFLAAVTSLIKRKKKIVHAVKNVSFRIKKGEVVAFLGPNGAGKSTTIKAMTSILHAEKGDLSVLGFDPWKDRKKYVAHIGAVFGQKSQLFWDLPPVDAYHLNKSIYKIPEEQFTTMLNELIKLLDIKDIVKRPTRRLSLGERMKCEFVMAMLHNPKILFLDEPTIGLDIFAKETIRKFIQKINKKYKTTIILTSHDLEDIEHVCDRCIVINNGEIVFDGPMKSLAVSTKKVITISFTEKVKGKIKERKGFTIKSFPSAYTVKLEVDTSEYSISKTIERLSTYGKIDDMEINNPPIVDTIKKLYKKK